MSFLSRLPHQIPFRAASAIRASSEAMVEGVFVCTANDALPAETMVVEAMAQFGGSLVFQSEGLLTGVDRCELLRPLIPGDVVACRVTLEAEFGGIYRFAASGSVDGVEAVRCRFYLASAANART